jgi:hypothetical protein
MHFLHFSAHHQSRTRYRAHRPVYVENFSKPGLQELISDGKDTFLAHSTGRRNITRLHTVFYTLPRHELLRRLFQIGWGLFTLDYRAEDIIELEFILSPTFGGASGWVWGILRKDYMEQTRRTRWDLVCFSFQAVVRRSNIDFRPGLKPQIA